MAAARLVTVAVGQSLDENRFWKTAQQVKALNDFYLENARIIRETITDLGYHLTGGVNGPYIWVKTGKDSWKFFDKVLQKAQVVTTPGTGFGPCGRGYIRISSFNSRENVEEAMARLRKVL